VATDARGNVYVAGQTSSPDFLSSDGATHQPTPPLLALTNGGQNIAPLPVANETSISAMGGTPDGKILYVAAGANVYYSSDRGATWRKTGAIPAPVFDTPQAPLVINDISVDAIDPSRAYIATSRGMYSTSDNGQDWFPRDYALAANFDGAIQAASVTVSQVDHTVLYSTTGRPNYLYKSTDAAGTWQQLNPLYAGEPAPNPFPPNQILFTLVPGGSDVYVINNNGTLIKSTDSGATWQKLSGGLFGAKSLRIDVANAANLYVLDNFGVQKSNDGGVTFTTVNPPGVAAGTTVQGMAYEPASATLYAAVNLSIYASADQGATWKPVPLSPAEFHTMQAIGGRVLVGITTPPATYLVKFDPTGQRLLYSMFFVNSPIVGIAALNVDSQGSAYLAGNTIARNFAGARQLSLPSPSSAITSYVAKVSADGSGLVYLSTLGASKGLSVQSMAVDSSGAVYLTGSTPSPDFPTTANAFQPALPSAACPRSSQLAPFEIVNFQNWAFVSKIAQDGASLVYSTFLGGACGSIGRGIAVNGAGEAFVGGFTTSPDLPTLDNAFQAAFPGPLHSSGYPNTLSAGFAVRLSAAGDKLLGATYVGGGYVSAVNAVAVDASGNPLLTGSTWGISSGATAGAYQSSVVYRCAEPISIGPSQPPSNGADAFLLKLDPALSKPAFLTYLGGSCFDAANSLALDAGGNAWLAGTSNSADFPVVDPFETKSSSTGFVSELSADGSKLLFSSFAEASSMSIDPHGSVYLAGSTIFAAAAKESGASAATAVLTRIDPAPAPPVEIDSIVPQSVNNNSSTLPTISFGSPVAPGQLVTIQGHKLGPATKVNTALDSNQRLPFAAAGTRVLFDGSPAPLISVEDTAIVCFVPFAVSQTTTVTVESSAGRSNALRVAVAPSAPQILVVVNPDNTINSAANSAPQGSVVGLYVSGLGQTAPPSVDGQVTAVPPAVPLAPVTVYVGGTAVTPQFVAAAVGLVAGITQVNVQIPAGNYQNGQSFISVNNSGAALYVK
jgi:uncharacterized protein (TIGR03437 family)